MKPIALRPSNISLAQAAKLLGVSKDTLKDAMRDRGMLVPTGHGLTPRMDLLQMKLLGTEAKCFYVNGVIPRHYQVITVSVKGLAWLAEELQKAPSQAA